MDALLGILVALLPSMATDNSSAFNWRYVVGRAPQVLSPHVSGRSIAINPWENPYRAGVFPHTDYLGRSAKHPAVIWAGGAVARIMAASLLWLGSVDTQHFDCWRSVRRAVSARPPS